MTSILDPPTFNLWTEPWITTEKPDGTLSSTGIEQLLLNAGKYRAIFDPSPLVIVGIHRLLVAILQDIFQPEIEENLQTLWRRDTFPPEPIAAFGEEYAHRFDLFSAETPFLQSGDIPLHPKKRGKGKSVGYLFEEQTAGTAVTHYNHTYEEEQMLCAACLAGGLVTLPAFASSGGAGIKPSINGVPPIYIIPGGHSFYQSLVASLVTPSYQPEVAHQTDDTPWWRHAPVIEKKKELLKVGYLHSLTFPARRVRLHPIPMSRPCVRCGQTTTWGAEEMLYTMGESRPKDAALWRDPFAAYRTRKNKEPIPIRPVEGRAVWREFAGLFLPTTGQMRPLVIGQLEEETVRAALPFDDLTPIPFQTVGLRTDMKMKIFEWERNGFLVPPKALEDSDIANTIERAIDFGGEVDRTMRYLFRKYFGGDHGDRHQNLRQRLSQAYWEALGPHFQPFILELGTVEDLSLPYGTWLDAVEKTAVEQFNTFAQQVGRDAVTLRQRVEATTHNRAAIRKTRREKYSPEVSP